MGEPYYPHPATVAYKVIEHLNTQRPGTQIASAPLAEAIGSDASTLNNSMGAAVNAGLVKRQRIMGLWHWSLGNGVPVADAQLDDADALLNPVIKGDDLAAIIARHNASLEKPAVAVPAPGVDMDRAPKPKPKAKPGPKPGAKAKPVKLVVPRKVYPEAEPTGLSFGWSSSGVVTLHKAGQMITLDPVEAAKLQAFLAHMAGFETAT